MAPTTVSRTDGRDEAPRSKLWFNGDEGADEYMLFQSACKSRLLRIPGGQKVDWLLDRLGSGPLTLAGTAPGFASLSDPTEIWNLLNSTYGSRNTSQSLNELDQLRQGNKSLEEHIIKFTQLCVEAEVTNEAGRIRRFKNSVRSDLAMVLLTQDSSTFDGMLRLAREVAPTLERQWRRVNTTAEKKAEKTPYRGRKERANIAQEMGENPPNHKDKTCYNCGKKGHIRPNCRSPKKETSKKATDAVIEDVTSEAEN